MKNYPFINFVQKALVLKLSTKAKMKTGVSFLMPEMQAFPYQRVDKRTGTK